MSIYTYTMNTTSGREAHKRLHDHVMNEFDRPASLPGIEAGVGSSAVVL